MAPRTKYQVGSVILALAVILLVVEVLGMTGVIPKYMPSRELNISALVLIIAASGLRRRGRAEMAAQGANR